MNQARYATSIVAKYLDTATVKANTKFYKTTLPAHMIFTKDMYPPVMNKLRSWQGNNTFTTELV